MCTASTSNASGLAWDDIVKCGSHDRRVTRTAHELALPNTHGPKIFKFKNDSSLSCLQKQKLKGRKPRVCQRVASTSGSILPSNICSQLVTYSMIPKRTS